MFSVLQKLSVLKILEIFAKVWIRKHCNLNDEAKPLHRDGYHVNFAQNVAKQKSGGKIKIEENVCQVCIIVCEVFTDISKFGCETSRSYRCNKQKILLSIRLSVFIAYAVKRTDCMVCKVTRIQGFPSLRVGIIPLVLSEWMAFEHLQLPY